MNPLPWWMRLPRWGWLLGLAICLTWDRAVYLALSARTPADIAAVEQAALYRIIWWLGRAEPWLLLAAVLIFRDWAAMGTDRVLRGLRRGVFLTLCVIGPGLAAELLKLVIRRLRPEATNGWSGFAWDRVDSLGALLNSSGLGTPSGHVACAFGAALAVRILFPRRALGIMLVFVLAFAVVAVRIVPAAHFLSDAWISIWIAAACVAFVYRLDGHNNGGVGLLDAPVTAIAHDAGLTAPRVDSLTPTVPAGAIAP